MKKFVEDIAAVDLEILGCIESFGEKHLPEAMKAIKLCMIPRIQLSLSMVPLDIARDVFTRWISSITLTANRINGFTIKEYDAKEVAEQW